MLLGTFNKMRDYFSPPYCDLWQAFRERLQQIDRLFVSGYSFGDKGVNSVVTDWLFGRKNSKLVLLHQDPEGCVREPALESTDCGANTLQKSPHTPTFCATRSGLS